LAVFQGAANNAGYFDGLANKRDRVRVLTAMKSIIILRHFLLSFSVWLFATAVLTAADDGAAPFQLTIVPSRSSAENQSIAMASKQPDEFYVVLTNISDSTQPVYESWNTWGYKNVSFEFATADGRKFVISKLDQLFTRNWPSTFLIRPGEHQVYPIRLDKWWKPFPGIAGKEEIAVTCRAIYQVPSTPDSQKQKVWVGRVESKAYDLIVRHW